MRGASHKCCGATAVRSEKIQDIGNGIADGVRIASSQQQRHWIRRILRHDERAGITWRAETAARDLNQIREVHRKGSPRAIAVLRIGDTPGHVHCQNARARQARRSTDLGDETIVGAPTAWAGDMPVPAFGAPGSGTPFVWVAPRNRMLPDGSTAPFTICAIAASSLGSDPVCKL